MAKGDTNSSCGGAANVVNSIIEEYLAQAKTINANAFVEFCGSLTISDPITYDIPNSSENFYIEGAVQYNDEYVVLFCNYQIEYSNKPHVAVSVKVSENTATVVNYVAYKERTTAVNVAIQAVSIAESNKILVNWGTELFLLSMSSEGFVTFLTSIIVPDISTAITSSLPIRIIKLSSNLFIVGYVNSNLDQFKCYAVKLTGESLSTGTICDTGTFALNLAFTPLLFSLGSNKFGIMYTDVKEVTSSGTDSGFGTIFKNYVFSVDSSLQISQVNYQQDLFRTNSIDRQALLDIKPLKGHEKFVVLAACGSIYRTVSSMSSISVADLIAAVIEFDNDRNTFSVGFFTKIDSYPARWMYGSNNVNTKIQYKIVPINAQRIIVINYYTLASVNPRQTAVQLIEGYISGRSIHFSEPLLTQAVRIGEQNLCFVKCGENLVYFGKSVINNVLTDKQMFLITPSPTQIKPSEVTIDGLLQSTATTTKAGKVALLKGVE